MFIYSQVCEDIHEGIGAMVLDPNGGAVRNIIRYAVDVGFEKVVVVNPAHFAVFNRWPTINPLIRKASTEEVLATFMDAIRNVWRQKEASATGNINRYLTSIITTLHHGGYSLNEAKYFMDRM